MIYYVEDDDNIRELVVYTLNQMGLPTRGFSDGAAFRAALALETPQLALLDIMLPGEDGMTLLRSLRANPLTKDIPVMMLTAKGEEYDKVAGLDGGADDYLCKPFGMAELAARVRALLRRAAPEETQDVLTSGALTLDTVKHTAQVAGEPVELTLKEYLLLNRLMSGKGRAFTREQLLDAVWGYDYDGGTRTVDVHIQTLRTKLKSAGGHICTVRGVGYRFEE